MRFSMDSNSEIVYEWNIIYQLNTYRTDRILLLTLSMTVFFVGATEFMLSSMLNPLAEAFQTSPAGASWLIFSYTLTYALLTSVLGYISDRVNRYKLLLIALLLFTIDAFAIVLAPTLEIAILLRVFGGLASTVLIPTTFAIVSDVVPHEHQAGAMDHVMLGMTFGIALGPALAGVLTDAIGWWAPLAVFGYHHILRVAERLVKDWVGLGNGRFFGH